MKKIEIVEKSKILRKNGGWNSIIKMAWYSKSKLSTFLLIILFTIGISLVAPSKFSPGTIFAEPGFRN